MFTQFHRLLKRIAEENQKAFHGKALSVYTINNSHGYQMAKLRVKKAEPKLVETTSPIKGHACCSVCMPANSR